MSDDGSGATRPGPARLVVSIGPGGTTGDWSHGGPAALDAAGMRRRLEEHSATQAAVRQERRAHLEGRLGDLGRRSDELAAEDVARGERRSRQQAALAEQTGAVDAVVERRRRLVGDLGAAVELLGEAVGEWQRVLDQHGSAEAALDALTSRTAEYDEATLAEITAEMTEGQAVLVRSEGARRAGVEESLAAVLALRDELAGETAPLGLAGLLRLRGALSANDEQEEGLAHTTLVSAVAKEREAVAAELAALEGEGPPDPLATLLDALASTAGDPLVVDDVLVDLGDAEAGAVLAALPALFADRGLVYLTDDLRVLSWAVALPDAVGGVVGALDSRALAG